MMAYLAHPYGGLDWNKADAALIAAGLKAEMLNGFGVFNPLDDLEELVHVGERDVLYCCKGALSACQLIIFCPGWEKSRGCRYEHFIAKMHGIPRIYLDEETATILRSLAPHFVIEGAAA